jgi:hypothetical protein
MRGKDVRRRAGCRMWTILDVIVRSLSSHSVFNDSIRPACSAQCHVCYLLAVLLQLGKHISHASSSKLWL